LAKLPISVLIDTYNHERFIEKAIVSVLEQDFPASQREILVVDDGSTDGTPAIAQKFQPHVRYLRKTNGGQASAFNAGIPECRGEIISFLDADDYWLPGKLSKVADVLARNQNVSFVGHGIKECFPDGRQNTVAPAKDERFQVDSLRAAQLFRLRRCYLGTSRMTMRAELARRILPAPESLVIEADEYLFTLAAVMSEVVILHEALTCYVIHGGNLYFSAGAGDAGARRKQKVLAALATSLNEALPALGLSREIVDCIVEIIQAESERDRLMLDGGAPWETLRAENKLFEVLHTDASTSQRIFRALTMIPASLLPSRWFYAGRRWLGNRAWYHGMRRGALSIPEVTEVAGPEEFKA
jgi:exopolysaccharide biosynthesis glycosyltransferase PssF